MSSVEFTAEVVRSTKFREKMRGYSQDEVDGFLERTAAAMDLLQERLGETTERALKAEAALESNSEADESIRKTLTLAQRTAELAVHEANDDAARIRTEAQEHADQLREEADREREQAHAEAASIVSEAQTDADDRLRDCEDRLAEMERDSSARIVEAQAQADADLAARAELAQRELDAVIASLTTQRAELYVQVDALATYLADERGRVVGALMSALEGFSETLNSTPRPAAVADAMVAAEAAVVVEEPAPARQTVADEFAVEVAEIVNEDEAGTSLVEAIEALHDQLAAEPEPGPAEVWFPNASDLAAPLMFSMSESAPRADGETMEEPDLVAAKPRKSILGRRKP